MRLAASIMAFSFTMSGLAAHAQQATQRSSAAAAQKPGVVEGIVVNQLTGEPVRRAEVRLMPVFQAQMAGGAGQMGPVVVGAIAPGGMFGGGPQGGRAVATDLDGRFRIENVQPGQYRVISQRSGFVAARVMGLAARNEVVAVAEGETVTGLRLTLLPQAVLAGRVLDEDGEPMQGVSVSVAARSRVPSRSRNLQGFRSNVTNDLGEFRITGVAPGKVLLSVLARSFMGGPAVEQPGETQALGYVPMYYPGVIDASQAQTIDVKPGMEITNLDVKLRRVAVFKVRGRAFDADGAPLQRFMAMANAVGQPQTLPSGASGGSREDGSFEISNLPVGEYTIIVRGMGRGGPGNQTSGTARVSVSGQNIDGLVIQIQPGFDVKGAAAVEGAGTKPAITGLRVSLASSEDGPFGGGVRPSPLAEDGTFTLSNLTPGRYRLSTSSPAAGLYLASVKVGGQEMFGRELDLSNGPPSGVQLVFRMDGGKVSGTIDPSEFKELTSPPTAVLVAADEALRESLPARSVQVSQTGGFEWTDIRPGEYLIWVYDNYDSGEIADPDFVKSVESRAVKVRVSAAQSANVSTKLTIWPSQY